MWLSWGCHRPVLLWHTQHLEFAATGAHHPELLPQAFCWGLEGPPGRGSSMSSFLSLPRYHILFPLALTSAVKSSQNSGRMWSLLACSFFLFFISGQNVLSCRPVLADWCCKYSPCQFSHQVQGHLLPAHLLAPFLPSPL